IFPDLGLDEENDRAAGLGQACQRARRAYDAVAHPADIDHHLARTLGDAGPVENAGELRDHGRPSFIGAAIGPNVTTTSQGAASSSSSSSSIHPPAITRRSAVRQCAPPTKRFRSRSTNVSSAGPSTAAI